MTTDNQWLGVDLDERDAERESLLASRALMLEAGWTLDQVREAYPLPMPVTKLEERWAKP
jgi:hypothetical protein